MFFFFLGFGKFLGEVRAICGVTSDFKVIKCAAFNIFIRGATFLPQNDKKPSTKHK